MMGTLHARVISESLRCELTWICDRNETSGRNAAARFTTRWVPEMEFNSVDAVIIASSTETHPALALAAIDAGKALLVEKPLADTLADTMQIVDSAAAGDIPLMCGFLERFNPVIRTAMEFVEAPVHAAAARHSPYVTRIRTGVASDLLIHDLDALIRLFGTRPTLQRGQLGEVHPDSDPGSEDIAEAILDFGAGRLATASASRVAQRKVRTLVITELDRQIELDLLRQDITIYRHVEHAASDDRTGLGYRQQTVIDIPVLRFQREPLAAQLDEFLDVVAGDHDLTAVRESLLEPHLALGALRASITSAES
ncbi:MAG: Gfo/Idh/MocA family oxidoreductase [Microthrixaceae bacterium]|nr:Gfo/Idh/MocA family oxidoreductase [Microthrixaceae bacterium]